MSHYDLSKFTPKSWINAIADEGSKQEMIWWLYEIDQERAQQATRVKELEKLLAQRAEVDALTYADLDAALNDSIGGILSEYAANLIRARAKEHAAKRHSGPEWKHK